MLQIDVAILGAGPAGLTAALSLACSGVAVTMIAPDERTRPADRRTTALLGSSINLLKNIGIWPKTKNFATPLEGIRLVDDCGSLFRAPEVTFRACELSLAEFGANIANARLVESLLDAVHEAPNITRIDAKVAEVACGETSATIALANGNACRARLIVAADGRNSLARKAASIDFETLSYPQSALAVSFAHAKKHHHVSTELHRRHGPLTCVPLSGDTSSLVWVEPPAEIERLAALGDDDFCACLEDALQGLLGRIHSPGPRGVFPLSVSTARQMGRNRVALVGEAAHVMPPIGAQGLNLGFRDAAALAEIVAEALSRGEDPGGAPTLRRYHDARYRDVVARQVTIDLLNRSLLSDFLPPHAFRGAGLHLLANIQPLREIVMRSGMGPQANLPRLMQDVPSPATL